MNNQQRKYIPVSDALPTKNYWIAFIIVAIILCFVNYNNARADIAYYNDRPLLEDISEDEENKILTATLVDSVIGCVFACAWGIILNIALRYKTWRWRWVLIYAITAIALCTAASSITNGKLTVGSVGWIWWAIIGLYRREYVNTYLKYVPQNEAPPSSVTISVSPSNNVFAPGFCTMCGKRISAEDKFCERCGTPVEIERDSLRSTESKTMTQRNVLCPKCGTYYISAPRCSYCGAENKEYIPPHVIVKDYTYIPSNHSEKASDFSTYFSTHKSLVDGICPSSVNPWADRDRKRIDFECKCFVSFLHHLTTREDEFSEIDIATYIENFDVSSEEIEAFNKRICDYLEIDLYGRTLPYTDVLLDKIECVEDEQAKCCKAINHIYAFSVFCKIAKRYAEHRDFKDSMNLLKSLNTYFLDDEVVQIFKTALETYNELQSSL